MGLGRLELPTPRRKGEAAVRSTREWPLARRPNERASPRHYRSVDIARGVHGDALGVRAVGISADGAGDQVVNDTVPQTSNPNPGYPAWVLRVGEQ